MEEFLKRSPALLIALRVLLGPVLVFLARGQASPVWIISVMLAAMLSDIFDGVIARRLHVVTPGLRVADSRADAWFFLCVCASAWLASADVIRAYALPLWIEVGLQIFSYGFDLVRYHRIASVHAYSTKIWAFFLYIAATGVIAFHFGALIWMSFSFGMISFLDTTAIKLILPGWRHDVLSSVHALKLRRGEAAT